jgi:hypothetical protein
MKIEFGKIDIGTIFFDPYCGAKFKKIDECRAEFIENNTLFDGFTDTFDLNEIIEAYEDCI